MPLREDLLVHRQPLVDQFPNGHDAVGALDLPVEQFLAFVLHDRPGGRKVCCPGRSVDPLPVDLQAVVPEASDLL